MFSITDGSSLSGSHTFRERTGSGSRWNWVCVSTADKHILKIRADISRWGKSKSNTLLVFCIFNLFYSFYLLITFYTNKHDIFILKHSCKLWWYFIHNNHLNSCQNAASEKPKLYYLSCLTVWLSPWFHTVTMDYYYYCTVTTYYIL